MQAVQVGFYTRDDFASRLDLAIERSEKARVVNPKVIEHDAGENE